MLVTVPFHSEIFKAKTNKEAYLKACKWVAKNVVGKENEMRETFWKVEQEDIGTYKLTLYCMLDYKDKERKFCEICQSYHKRFYYNEERDCSRCNLKAFKKRIDEGLTIKKAYRKELISKKPSGGDDD